MSTFEGPRSGWSGWLEPGWGQGGNFEGRGARVEDGFGPFLSDFSSFGRFWPFLGPGARSWVRGCRLSGLLRGSWIGVLGLWHFWPFLAVFVDFGAFFVFSRPGAVSFGVRAFIFFVAARLPSRAFARFAYI